MDKALENLNSLMFGARFSNVKFVKVISSVALYGCVVNVCSFFFSNQMIYNQNVFLLCNKINVITVNLIVVGWERGLAGGHTDGCRALKSAECV